MGLSGDVFLLFLLYVITWAVNDVPSLQEYVDPDNAKQRPIMIHRAIFGSLERFFGILVENYAGRLALLLAFKRRIMLWEAGASVGLQYKKYAVGGWGFCCQSKDELCWEAGAFVGIQGKNFAGRLAPVLAPRAVKVIVWPFAKVRIPNAVSLFRS